MRGGLNVRPLYLKDKQMIKEQKLKLEAWLNSIQNGEGDLLDWFLFTGFVVFVSYLWMQVIKRIVD
jgi:hypothetical protein